MRRSLISLLCIALVACTSHGSGSRPGASSTGGARVDGAIVVASFNFSESALVAEIYAQALERAGLPVQRELSLGPRELVQPALAQGLVDLVPEYLGTALRSVDPTAPVDTSDPVAVRAALDRAVSPWKLETLVPSAAQDQNGLVVTRTRAAALGLRSVSDLAAHAGSLVLGGPPECPTRQFCLVGLEHVYGLHFAQFVPLATLAQEQTALEQGVIDVAVMFTTDGRLGDPNLVLLDDDRNLQPVDNVVPLVSANALDRYGSRLTSAIDAVSEQLTTTNLVFLNWRVDVAHRDIASEASGWLDRHPPP